jgi:hypothetical protein
MDSSGGITERSLWLRTVPAPPMPVEKSPEGGVTVTRGGVGSIIAPNALW